jgi:hypothetical protein
VKRLLRSRTAQSLLAWLVTLYVKMLIATLRWRFEGRALADAAILSGDGVIGLFWHGRIAHAMACRRILRDKPRRVMISLSRDGEFIAMAAARLGIPTIRGSAGRQEGVLAKGGAAAFRAAVKTIEGGGAVLVTPDGPRGPRETMQIGAVKLARAGRCPVFLIGLAARPALRFGGWDGACIPLPFSRACLVIDGPLRTPADADGAAMEATRADWQQRMTVAQAQAEARLARVDRR